MMNSSKGGLSEQETPGAKARRPLQNCPAQASSQHTLGSTRLCSRDQHQQSVVGTIAPLTCWLSLGSTAGCMSWRWRKQMDACSMSEIIGRLMVDTCMGPRYLPSPLIAVKSRSSSLTSKPRFKRPTASTSPPMPAPAMTTFVGRCAGGASWLAACACAGKRFSGPRPCTRSCF